MDKNFGGVIWTKHALEKMRERGIKQSDAWFVWKRPDQSRFAKAKGGWIYYKTFKGVKYEVVATQNKNKEWIIISVWSKKIN